jgi:hypothetical protein
MTGARGGVIDGTLTRGEYRSPLAEVFDWQEARWAVCYGSRPSDARTAVRSPTSTRDLYRAAAKILLTDREDSLTAYLRFPRAPIRGVRRSNFIERTFRETRRESR